MKHDQVHQEHEGHRVEDDHYYQCNLEFRGQLLREEIDVVGNQDLVICCNLIDYHRIGDIMDEAQPEYQDDQFEKVIVILLSNAVVQVHAVVVKARCAPVALSTVLRPYKNMCFANLAVVLVLFSIKEDRLESTGLFQRNRRILWVDLRAQHSIIADCDGNDGVY